MPPSVASRIASVSVFRTGAVVTRVADVPEGQEHVSVGGLPLALDNGSVRVALLDGGDAVASDVRIALEVPTFDAARPPARTSELEAVRREVRRLSESRAQIERERSRFAGFDVPARPEGRPGRAPLESPTRARLELVALRERLFAENLTEHEENTRALAEAQRRLSVLEDEHARASTARNAEPHELRKSAVVRLRGAVTKGARLSITYSVPGARWAPSYVLKLDRTLVRGRLAVRAVVCQRTGEDWRGVRLTLSTANLQAWTELPELMSLRLGQKQPKKKRGWKAPPRGADELYADNDRVFGPPAPEPHQPVVFLAPPPAVQPIAPPMMAPMPAMAPMPMRGAAPGGTPAFAAAPAPAPQGFGGAPPMQEASRSRTKGAPRMARQEMAREKHDDSLAEGGPVAGGGGDGPMPVEEIEPAEDLFDFGKLRMPAWDAQARGKLRPMSVRDELSGTDVVTSNIDVMAVMAQARQTADEALSASLPRGHRAAESAFGFDYAYAAEAEVDVPSDGAFHALALSSGMATGKPRYVAVPRETSDVFRFVEVENPLEAPLLEGPIDVYVGDAFLVASRVSTTPPRGVVRLGLGVEQAIKLARNTRYREETAGLVGGTLLLWHEIEIEVVSHMHAPIALEVRERVPVTREGEDDIEVRMGKVDPPWEKYEQREAPMEGSYAWNVKLGPGEKRALNAGYVVKIASKNELWGGNRREV